MIYTLLTPKTPGLKMLTDLQGHLLGRQQVQVGLPYPWVNSNPYSDIQIISTILGSLVITVGAGK